MSRTRGNLKQTGHRGRGKAEKQIRGDTMFSPTVPGYSFYDWEGLHIVCQADPLNNSGEQLLFPSTYEDAAIAEVKNHIPSQAGVAYGAYL